MQVQPINNNTSFKALKGLRYVGGFNPEINHKHAKMVYEVINSQAIKDFGKIYDFIARFEYSDGYEPITMIHFPYYYSLELLPAPVKRTTQPRQQSSFCKFFRNILGKNKKEPINELPKEEISQEAITKNLPTSFIVANGLDEDRSQAYEKTLRDIKILRPNDLIWRLEAEIKDQKEEQQAEEAKRQEHARILDEINENFS